MKYRLFTRTSLYLFANHFPICFVANVSLHDVHHITIQTNKGASILMELCSEHAHGKPRYAFKGWQSFMRGVGLVSGRPYLLRYERNNGVLIISDVI
ncbi:putative DNA-binding pseudobarrel domain superfamily [Helianthus anomalus]